MIVFNKPSADGSFYPCLCCGFRTLAERGAYKLCPVCNWEDDGQDEEDKDEVHGLNGLNHDLSLSQARLNFDEFWACERRFIDKVRKPTGDEI